MSINLESSSLELFEIKRDKKTLLLFLIAGIAFIGISAAFLIFFHMVLGAIGNGIFISIIGIGVAIILYSIQNMNSLLIKADSLGVWFNITFLASGIFIPWAGIKCIDSDYAQALIAASQSGYRRAASVKCLMFELTDEYSKKIPLFIKNAYLKTGNKIYFRQTVLSVTIDNAVENLSALHKKNS